MRVFGLAGWSGSGKTTLLEKLLPILRDRGVRVSTLKQTHHAVDLDQPGKDSWRHRLAGVQEVMLASSRRWVLMRELHEAEAPPLGELLQRFSPCDLVLVEGFKSAAIPKLEIHRSVLRKPLLYPQDSDIVAIASDVPVCAPLPVLNLDDVAEIAALIMKVVDWHE